MSEENELLFDELYEKTKDCGRVQFIKLLMQKERENQELKKQLNYLRSGEYYNQLRFENEMLQQVVDTNGVPSEVYDYIDCTHRNTELLEELEEEKRINVEDLKTIDRQQEIIQELKIQVSAREEVANKYKEVIDKINKYINKMFDTGFYNDDYYLGHLKMILEDKEVK